MLQGLARPERGPNGFDSNIQTSVNSELPQARETLFVGAQKQRRVHEVTVDPAIYSPNSWLRTTVESIKTWSKDLPLSLHPVTDWARKATRREQRGDSDALLTTVTGEEYSMKYALRIYSLQTPGPLTPINRQFVDLNLHAIGSNWGAEKLESLIQVDCYSTKKQPILPADRQFGGLRSFSNSTYPHYLVGLPATTADEQVLTHCSMLNRTAPCLYIEGFARGYAIGNSSRFEVQIARNDLVVSPELSALSHPKNRELLLLQQALFYALQPQLLKTDRNTCTDDESRVHWKIQTSGTFGSPRCLAQVQGSFVRRDYPMRVTVLDSSGKNAHFFRHFNHPILLQTFVEGLSHGIHVGDALARPIRHWWEKT
ncbi:MAG: hypothetical protein K1X79_04205 [Oligoflexia bacterium]|nr:hypothetical protein [Oligoflexia bacterium]